MSYVKWKPDSSDQTTLQLHHQSLTIPPETKINHSIVKELDDTYQYYDRKLSATLQKIDSLVDQINETAEDSLSVFLLRRISQASISASPLQPTVSIQHTSSYEQPQVTRSTRPVRKNRRALLFSRSRFNSKKGVKKKGTKRLNFWSKIHSGIAYSI